MPLMKVTGMFDLTGEVAVVVGGTGVLGGALADALGAAGAAVAIVGRNATKGTQRAQAIESAHGRSAFFAADALSRASLTSAHQAIVSTLGHPTVLVNAAGGNDPKVTVTADRKFEDITLPDWAACFDLNVVGGILLPCQEFGPGMLLRGKGSIINIASVAAHIPLSRVVTYSAAKAAVLNITMFLGREWAGKGLRVNSITPGFFPAEQNRKLLFNEDGSPTARTSSIWAHTPLGRFGRPEELAGATIFLASQASSFITATDIRVDGGFLAQTI